MNAACVCMVDGKRRCGAHGVITPAMRAAARGGRDVGDVNAPYLQDADLTLYVGDCLDVLRSLPDGSVDCVVTSPPYWGLRDYGTGSWDGGDPDCDHAGTEWRTMPPGTEKHASNHGANGVRSGDCKCGARRIDRQLGLEPTPDEYVARMVAVFREVRRVLAAHGTCWVNLGDSYATGTTAPSKPSSDVDNGYWQNADKLGRSRIDGREAGLKPKDLVGIPWRVAFALQADGWYLRSDIIWAKNNPMPESVTDRPTKAHEYVFLLSKGPRYWFDAEAVREPHSPDGRKVTAVVGRNGSIQHRDGERWPNGGRNIRSVWEIATQPYAGAHFATYPEALVRRCILAGCPEWVCGTCGKPRERIVERVSEGKSYAVGKSDAKRGANLRTAFSGYDNGDSAPAFKTLGWSDCGHDDYRPGVVLDPFLGSGTTALVARKHGRHSIGIELNEEYARLAAERTRQLSLLGGAA